MRGGIHPGGIAGLSQDGREHRCDGALSIGAGHMDEAELSFWVAQKGHQRLHPLQPQAAALPAGGMEEVGELLRCHNVSTFFPYRPISRTMVPMAINWIGPSTAH